MKPIINLISKIVSKFNVKNNLMRDAADSVYLDMRFIHVLGRLGKKLKGE